MPASADVVLTFDSDTEGFAVTGTTTGAVVSHAIVGGEGMLKLEAPAGWAGDMAKLDASNWSSALFDEVTAAAVNGGTISYDVLILESDQTYTTAPQWFETTHITQGEFAGYDSDTVRYGLNSGSWPLAGGQFATTVVAPITTTAPGADDVSGYFDVTDTWRNFHFGLNNDSGNLTGNAVVYFDNLTFSANAVPEPSTLAILGAFGLIGMVRRRR
ncbi:PEP-CTERM sorting domain-containing protein [Mariniblastus fucicola]|uniref:Ice-binding protein C-terminal domain-containing protein n=1 Tax=Mariniblastus fucicola TaxID=980251 RepID=A0A5B9PMV1_9BACT|nr:PEP-CTERM sorting domain-containing protein [Mariniblastus fucicola]QEG23921.1 hypothetical protein MFFC18_38260 [Mariniblastus fucicola]